MLVVAVGAIVVGAVLLSTASSQHERGARKGGRVEGAQSHSAGTAQAGGTSGRRPMRSAAAEGQAGLDDGDALGSALSRFRIVDATFGFGLPTAVCVSGTRADSSDSDGWVEVDSRASTSVEIRAPRYRAQTFAASPGDGELVSLVPTLEARVTVRSGGGEAAPPPPGLRARLRPLFADGRVSHRPTDDAEDDLTLDVPLDDEGNVSTPTALSLAFDIIDRNGTKLCTDTVRPGEHRAVELASGHLRVGVLEVRDDRTLEGVRFHARSGGARASVSSTVVSDSEGVLLIPLQSDGLVRRPQDVGPAGTGRGG